MCAHHVLLCLLSHAHPKRRHSRHRLYVPAGHLVRKPRTLPVRAALWATRIVLFVSPLNSLQVRGELLRRVLLLHDARHVRPAGRIPLQGFVNFLHLRRHATCSLGFNPAWKAREANRILPLAPAVRSGMRRALGLPERDFDDCLTVGVFEPCATCQGAPPAPRPCALPHSRSSLGRGSVLTVHGCVSCRCSPQCAQPASGAGSTHRKHRRKGQHNQGGRHSSLTTLPVPSLHC